MIYLIASVCVITVIALKVRDNTKKIKSLQSKLDKDNKNEKKLTVDQ